MLRGVSSNLVATTEASKLRLQNIIIETVENNFYVKGLKKSTSASAERIQLRAAESGKAAELKTLEKTLHSDLEEAENELSLLIACRDTLRRRLDEDHALERDEKKEQMQREQQLFESRLPQQQQQQQHTRHYHHQHQQQVQLPHQIPQPFTRPSYPPSTPTNTTLDFTRVVVEEVIDFSDWSTDASDDRPWYQQSKGRKRSGQALLQHGFRTGSELIREVRPSNI